MTRRRKARIRRARNLLIRQRLHTRRWIETRQPRTLLDGARAARQFRDDRRYRDYVLGYDRWTRAERLQREEQEGRLG